MSTVCKIVLGGVPMSMNVIHADDGYMLVLEGITSNPDEVLDDVKRVFSDCSMVYFYYEKKHLLKIYVW